MRVVVQQNRNRPDQRLAFIKGNVPLWGEFSLPAYFPKELTVQPDIGSTIEVMISGMLWHKDDNGYFNYRRAPKCFFIKEPTRETKVKYNGFDCSGSMCQTLSSASDFTTGKRIGLITPGRLQQILIVADNTSRAFYGKPELPLTPGVGWIARNPNNLMWRLEGVEGLEQLDVWRTNEELEKADAE